MISEMTVGELVARDIRKATVLKKFGIDFCCGGKIKLKDACQAKGIEVQDVVQSLDKVTGSRAKAGISRFNEWELDFLIDYIVYNHHAYVRKILGDLPGHLSKVVAVHGTNHPEVIQIASIFEEISKELRSHLEKEEQVLFPYVKELMICWQKKTSPPQAGFGEVENPIGVMEKEHEVAGTSMEKIRELSDNYTAPEDACNTFRLVYEHLKEFEEDLHQHIHLENNILFPKAIALQKALFEVPRQVESPAR